MKSNNTITGTYWKVKWIVTSILNGRLRTRDSPLRPPFRQNQNANHRSSLPAIKLVDPLTSLNHADESPQSFQVKTPGDPNMKVGACSCHPDSKVANTLRGEDDIFTEARNLTNDNMKAQDILDSKLKAWYYRYSYIERWTTAYKKMHGLIASQQDKNNDIQYCRNFKRMRQHAQDLRSMGCFEPLKYFQERGLYPQHDRRFISIPQTNKNVAFKIVEDSINEMEMTLNLALDWRKSPKNVNRFHTPSRYVKSASVREWRDLV